MSSTDGWVRVWNVNTGAKLGQLHDPAVPLSAAFTPDGTKVVIASVCGSARNAGSRPARVASARRATDRPIDNALQLAARIDASDQTSPSTQARVARLPIWSSLNRRMPSSKRAARSQPPPQRLVPSPVPPTPITASNSSTQIVLWSHGTDLIQFPEWAAAVYNG